MLIHPSPLRVPPSLAGCTHAGSGPSRVRRRLLRTCLRDPIPLATCPVKFSSSTLKFVSYSWTLLQSCNVVNPGRYSTRTPLDHHICLPKTLYSVPTSTCLPRQYLIVGSRSSFQGMTQNLKVVDLCVRETDDFFITNQR